MSDKPINFKKYIIITLLILVADSIITSVLLLSGNIFLQIAGWVLMIVLVYGIFVFLKKLIKEKFGD